MTDQQQAGAQARADGAATAARRRRITIGAVGAAVLTVLVVGAVMALPRAADPDRREGSATHEGSATGSPPTDTRPSTGAATPSQLSTSTTLPVDPRGRPAPDFTLDPLDGRARLSLAGLRGRVVVLNYWASWCSECRAESAVLASGYVRWHPQQVEFVGIDVQDDPEHARAFLRGSPAPYASFVDPAGTVARQYGLTGLPATFVLDRKGRIVAKCVGAIDTESLDAAVRLALSS